MEQEVHLEVVDHLVQEQVQAHPQQPVDHSVQAQVQDLAEHLVQVQVQELAQEQKLVEYLVVADK